MVGRNSVRTMTPLVLTKHLFAHRRIIKRFSFTVGISNAITASYLTQIINWYILVLFKYVVSTAETEKLCCQCYIMSDGRQWFHTTLSQLVSWKYPIIWPQRLSKTTAILSGLPDRLYNRTPNPPNKAAVPPARFTIAEQTVCRNMFLYLCVHRKVSDL
jgi:hypothetical protein